MQVLNMAMATVVSIPLLSIPIQLLKAVQMGSLTTTRFCLAMDHDFGPDEQVFEKDLKELLKLTNEERKKAGVPALTSNAKLQAAASQHSANMARQEKLAHELDDKNPSDRLKEQKYKFSALAENIAEGQRTPAEVVKSWMGSEAHRTNLLNAEYTEIGLGIADSAQGRTLLDAGVCEA